VAAVWIIIIIISILLMILIHESGHFFAAKAVGIKVEQFSIGFGREIVGWDRGETRYSIKWFLGGGSTKICGMNPDEEVSEEDKPRCYGEAPAWKRAVVVAAGSAVHFVAAFIIIFLIWWPIGLKSQEPVSAARLFKVNKTITDFQGKDVPAPGYQAGLKKGDTVVGVDGKTIRTWDDFVKEISNRAGQTVILKVKRGDKTLDLVIKPVNGEGGRGMVGVQVETKTVTQRDNPITAIRDAARGVGSVTVAIFKGIGSLFTVKTLKMLVGLAPRGNQGPVTIVGAARIAYESKTLGVSAFLEVLAWIFIAVGIFNLLPAPPLDGGFLLVVLIEVIFRRRIDLRKLMPITVAVIVILTLVAIRLLILDIVHPIRLPLR
jgi:regulator of sigma E protease